MSSEHADVYERGELDQDTGGDQDVDIRYGIRRHNTVYSQVQYSKLFSKMKLYM
jgi:hypothetical protein